MASTYCSSFYPPIQSCAHVFISHKWLLSEFMLQTHSCYVRWLLYVEPPGSRWGPPTIRPVGLKQEGWVITTGVLCENGDCVWVYIYAASKKNWGPLNVKYHINSNFFTTFLSVQHLLMDVWGILVLQKFSVAFLDTDSSVHELADTNPVLAELLP